MQDRDVEVDDQAHSFFGQLQVGQELGLVDAEQSFHSFQFHYYFIGDNQINSIFSARLQPLVEDGQFYLCQEWNVSKPKLLTHTFFVNRFKKSRSKLSMHLDGRTNNALRQRLTKKPNISPCLRVSVVGVHSPPMATLTPVFFANPVSA